MTSLSITDGVCTSLLNDVRTWGARGVETGGFLLANPKRAHLDPGPGR